MHSTYRSGRKLRWTRATLTVVAALGVIGVAYRIHRASGFGIVDLITSIATVVLVSGALTAGWVMHVRKIRADNAAEVALKVVDINADDEADRALWDSIPAATIDEDTIAFDKKVVLLDRFRFPRAG